MNWGTKITVLYLGFVALIVSLAVVSASQDIELESKDYYAQELKYQHKIDALNNTNGLTSSVSFVQNENDILLQFPKTQASTGIKGDILFFCVYNSKLDKKIKINANSNGEQLVPLSLLAKATYKMKISWNVLGKDFYKENSITIK